MDIGGIEVYLCQYLCCGIYYLLWCIRGLWVYGGFFVKIIVIDQCIGDFIIVVIVMNFWFCLFYLLLCSLFWLKLEVLFGVLWLQFWVLFNDLDSNLYMINGCYWNIFDLGWLDLILCMGLGWVVLCEKWVLIVGVGIIQFCCELKLFQCFILEMCLVGWVGLCGIMEQCVLIGFEQKIVICVLLVIGIYDCCVCQFLGMLKMMEVIGVVVLFLLLFSVVVEVLLVVDVVLKQDDV